MYTLSTISSYHVSDPPETYIYDIIPVSGGVAAISSDDSLRFFDPTNLDAGPLHSVRRVNADVTCMQVLGSGELGDGSVVCTAGRDGKAVMLDPRTGGRVGEVASGELACYSWHLQISSTLCSASLRDISRRFSLFLFLLHMTRRLNLKGIVRVW